MAAMTIFYDGYCPLCVAEMRQLQQYDKQGELAFEDIQAGDFAERFPQIDPLAADRILHGLLADGRLVLGLDVSCRAWSMVGQKRWLRVLRLPLIRLIADACYRFFAKNRYQISFLLTGRRRCRPCELKRR